MMQFMCKLSGALFLVSLWTPLIGWKPWSEMWVVNIVFGVLFFLFWFMGIGERITEHGYNMELCGFIDKEEG